MLECKNLLNPFVEGGCNQESQFERWVVFGILNRDDCLPGHADRFGQLLLRHLISIEA